MSIKINKDNYIDAKYDVFKKFHQQLGIVTTGFAEDFRAMTIGWGAMGNVWAHPGSAITIYINPGRYTFEYLQKNDYFVVSFLPEKNHDDVIILGRNSGRDVNKISLTSLTPITLEHGVGFEQAELTFVCKKIFSQQFDINCVPGNVRDGIYTKMEPHYIFIGYIEDAQGEALL